MANSVSDARVCSVLVFGSVSAVVIGAVFLVFFVGCFFWVMAAVLCFVLLVVFVVLVVVFCVF